MTNFETANRFWENVEKRIVDMLLISEHADAFMGMIEENIFTMEGFMMDLFDNGDYEPTDEEILEAIEEVTR